MASDKHENPALVFQHARVVIPGAILTLKTVRNFAFKIARIDPNL
jgi:hypothetical protein